MPRRTAIHSRRSGVTRSASVRVNTHNGLDDASTRWPTLKTGPWPARIWWTTRKWMKPSSDIQRRDHARAARTTSGVASTADCAQPAARRRAGCDRTSSGAAMLTTASEADQAGLIEQGPDARGGESRRPQTSALGSSPPTPPRPTRSQHVRDQDDQREERSSAPPQRDRSRDRQPRSRSRRPIRQARGLHHRSTPLGPRSVAGEGERNPMCAPRGRTARGASECNERRGAGIRHRPWRDHSRFHSSQGKDSDRGGSQDARPNLTGQRTSKPDNGCGREIPPVSGRVAGLLDGRGGGSTATVRPSATKLATRC